MAMSPITHEIDLMIAQSTHDFTTHDFTTHAPISPVRIHERAAESGTVHINCPRPHPPLKDEERMRLQRQFALRSEQMQEQWRANKRQQEDEARERERREWEDRLIHRENKIMEQIEARDRLEAHNKVTYQQERTDQQFNHNFSFQSNILSRSCAVRRSG